MLFPSTLTRRFLKALYLEIDICDSIGCGHPANLIDNGVNDNDISTVILISAFYF